MIAVTGATGMTGRFVLAALRQQGYAGSIRCLVRPTSDLEDLHGLIDPVYGDCADPAALQDLLAGCERLIHVAGIRFARHVLAACEQTRIRRVVFVNTTGIYSKYRSVAADYQVLEALILDSSLDFTIIRPTMIYGTHLDHNIHKLIKLIERHRIIPLVGKGRAMVQPIHAEDLARVIVTATLSDRAIKKDYNVAGAYPLSYAQLLRETAQALNLRVAFLNIPYVMALTAGYIGELFPGGLLKAERIKRLREDKAFPYTQAALDLGFSPRSFRDGVQLEVAEMKARGLIRTQ